MLNITKSWTPVSKLEDPLQDVNVDVLTVLFLSIPFGITQLLGNGLLLGIIIYEKYGVDPQKRTLVNMLVGHLCWTIIFLNVTEYPIPTLRYLTGPYRKQH